MQVTQAMQELEARTEALDARAADLQREAARQESAQAELDAGSAAPWHSLAMTDPTPGYSA